MLAVMLLLYTEDLSQRLFHRKNIFKNRTEIGSFKLSDFTSKFAFLIVLAKYKLCVN